MINRIEAHSMPLDRWHDNYQEYYAHGLSLNADSNNFVFKWVTTGQFPKLLKQISNINNIDRMKLFHPILSLLAKNLTSHDRSFSGNPHSLVGEYQVELDRGRILNFCIDASDSMEIQSTKLAEWADLYFKTNFSRKLTYPQNVLPMINGSKFCLHNMSMLNSMRMLTSEYDFSAVLRIWGGTNSTDGIEHNIRILEELNKVPTKKKLIAGVLAAGSRKEIKKRLESQGILVLDKLLPLKTIWELGPKSRYSIQRLGMHYCLHWRFIESLASGTSIILDADPRTVWPEPLIKGVHFESLGLDVDIDTPVASDSSYINIAAKMDDFLSRPNLPNMLRENAARYFDLHASPDVIGNYILSIIRNFSANN